MQVRKLTATACWLGFAAAFLVAGGAFAGEEHPDGPHLRFMQTYEAAMRESRIRNVPIFFSRHKDF